MDSIRNKNTQILTISKNSADNQATETYQAVKFTSDFKIHEILEAISKMNSKNHPNLSIFIIEDKNFKFSESNGRTNSRQSDIDALKEYVARVNSCFSTIMMILISKDENVSKFYKRNDFNQLNEMTSDDFVKFTDDQLLNLMVEQGKWSKNSEDVKVYEEFFKIIFKERNFYKTFKAQNLNEGFEDEKAKSLENLLELKSEPLDYDIFGSVPQSLITQPALVQKSAQEFTANSELSLKNSKFRKLDKNSKLCHLKNVKIEKLSQEEMLKDIKTMRIILISGKPNSGKSWILKSLSNQLRSQCPEKYTIYVDLEKLSQEFEDDPDIATFVANKITNLRNSFEAEVFKKLYKNGKVNIFIDNIQTSSSKSAKLLTKIYQSFQKNDGNQLWIAARTDFEVNLKKKLKLDAVYELDELIKKSRRELINLCHKLLEREVKNNKSLEFHRILWENIRKYFDFSEIYQIIQHSVQSKMHSEQEIHPLDGKNQLSQNESKIILTAIEHNTNEVAELTWKEIKATLIKNNAHIQNTSEPRENLEYNELAREFEELRSTNEDSTISSTKNHEEKKSRKTASESHDDKESRKQRETEKIKEPGSKQYISKKESNQNVASKHSDEEYNSSTFEENKDEKNEKDKNCPFDSGLEPEKIIGATDTNGELAFLIKWKNSNTDMFIPSKIARKHCPQLVINFYEKHLTWSKD